MSVIFAAGEEVPVIYFVPVFVMINPLCLVETRLILSLGINLEEYRTGYG